MDVFLCNTSFHTNKGGLVLGCFINYMSGLNTVSIITLCYNVCYTPTAPHSSALAHLAYGRPPTLEPNTHNTYSHLQQDVRGSSHHVWVSAICRWVLGFPSSAVVSCQDRKLRYMVGYFLWLPMDAGTQWFFDFLNDVCMSQKLSRGTWYPTLRDTYHPEDDFLIML